MKYMQTAAFFMICLMIALPVYSAQAFASLTTYSVNKDGVRNYRAVTDTTTVMANITETGVTASDVKLLTQKSSSFPTCTYTTERSFCSYPFTEGSWPAGKWDYSVEYKGDVAANSIIVDSLAPEITIYDVISAEELKVYYSVKERAYNENDDSACSGIKTVNFLLGGETLTSVEVNAHPGRECNYYSESEPALESMEATSTGGEEKLFCVRAVDNVDNVGQQCIEIVVDKERSIASELEILNQQNLPIEYVAAKVGPMPVKLKFELDEYELQSVTADASEFTIHDSQKAQQNALSAVCERESEDENYQCEVSDVILSLPEGGNPVLYLKVTDQSGNTAELSLQANIRADNTQPRVLSIKANQCGTQDSIGPKNNLITAVIEEADSGLGGKKVYLDLSSVLGSNYRQVSPYECTQSGITWICKWWIPSVTTTPGSSILGINIVSPSQDDAGNPMQTISTGLRFDSVPPEITEHEIIASSSLAFGEDIKDYPTSGGTIQLRIKIKESLPAKATADFSKVSSAGKRTVSCTGNEEKECVFTEVGPLLNGPLNNLPIDINITDCAGNANRFGVKMNISAISTKTGNYWNYAVGEAHPANIDRQVLKVIPQKIFFPVSASGASADIIVQEIVDCEGDTGFLDFNIDDKRLPDIINSPSANPIIKFNIQQKTEPPDNVDLVCTVKTISRTSAGAVTMPETDDMTFRLSFQGAALGTIDAVLREKLDAVRNSGLVQFKLIGSLDKIVRQLESACGIYGTLLAIAELLNNIGVILGVLDATVLEPISQAHKQTSFSFTYTVQSAVGKVMGPLCKFMSCELKFQEKIKSFIEKWQSGGLAGVKKGKTLEQAFGFKEFNINPKDSLIVSAATICVPGIVYNLQKARAIECNYIRCVENDVAAGVPPYFCSAQRAEQWCKYVWGEIFQILPYVQFIDYVIEQVKTLIMDPIKTIISTAIAKCSIIFLTAPQSYCLKAINIIEKVKVVLDLGSFKKRWKGIFHPESDICAEVLAEE